MIRSLLISCSQRLDYTNNLQNKKLIIIEYAYIKMTIVKIAEKNIQCNLQRTLHNIGNTVYQYEHAN